LPMVIQGKRVASAKTPPNRPNHRRGKRKIKNDRTRKREVIDVNDEMIFMFLCLFFSITALIWIFIKHR
jgi:hypothetical protein